MNRIIFSLFLSAIFFVGCKNKVDDKLEKEIIKTLEENNKILNISNKEIESSFDILLQRPQTKEKAKIWFRKTKIADTLLNQFLNSIDSLDSTSPDLNLLFNSYIRYIEKIDNWSNEELKDAFEKFKLNENNKGKSNKLEKEIYKNKASIIRNMFNKYCLLQIGSTDGEGFYDSFSVITAQNSTHFKPNENLEITAGVASFSKASKPRITIAGRIIPLNDDAVAEYKINVGNKIGTFKKLVKISFTKPDGTLGTSTKEIIYTVD